MVNIAFPKVTQFRTTTLRQKSKTLPPTDTNLPMTFISAKYSDEIEFDAIWSKVYLMCIAFPKVALLLITTGPEFLTLLDQ